MEKEKRVKWSVLIVAGTLGVLLGAGVFLSSLLDGITEKMNQSANETLLDSTRMIASSLESEIGVDQELIKTFATLLPGMKFQGYSGENLRQFNDATDFFRLSYISMEGNGVNDLGEPVSLSGLPFEETAAALGEAGYSAAYNGASGRLQITFQAPVFEDGVQTGAIYGDKVLSAYNSPALFTFSGGAGRAYVVDGTSGSWIIESTGTEGDDLFSFLDEHGNGGAVRDKLREVLLAGKTGVLGIRFRGEESFLCFLPLSGAHHWYLVSIMPKRVLQQESSDIMGMIHVTLFVLVAALVIIAFLLLGRQAMKSREKERTYRERLFGNISSNVDFAFLLYSPEGRRVELVSDNVSFLFDADHKTVARRPELLFDKCGVPADDPGRTAFFTGALRERVRREYCVAGGAHELQRWVDVHLIPADGGQYLAVLHETTGEHHMRDTLAEALKQSQESNRARTAFFSSMSHDIRTPMNGIIGMTSIAMANLDDRLKVADCLEKIKVASDHLLSLINEVLDMSRIESGKLSLKQEPVHLPELISNLILFVKPDLTRKKQTLQVKSGALSHDTILSDALHLQKVLLNLLSNAVKYTQEGGEIALYFEEQPRQDGRVEVRFTVRDNGMGMSEDFLQRLFTPFERAEDNRVSKVSGTGLGMAITKNIVDMMEGAIAVESTPGEGSTFRVTIPAALPEGGTLDTGALSGCSALVVDDDRDACESIQLMLDEVGVRTDWVLSGPEAVEAAAGAHETGSDYFAVIVDWKMPGMDGIETARRIRSALGEDVPILLLSAYDWEEVKEEALEAGINGFLTKPIFKSELVQALRHYLTGAGGKAAKPLRPPEKEQFTGVRILLAEDNELNREIVEEILSESGIQVESAEDGGQAVERFAQAEPGRFDMIFMDIHMPVMDGYQATRALRALPRADAGTVPIIAMTADAFTEDIQRCKEAGMDAHISKPIDLDRLFELIRQYRNRGKDVGE